MNTGLSYHEEQDLNMMSEMDKCSTDLSIEEAVNRWMQWAGSNFPKSDAKASLIHLQEEIKEVIEALEADMPNPANKEGIPLMEYADCMLCLLTAAGKSGFTIDQLFRAIKNKMDINFRRKWKLNDDNTYSHIKS